MVTGIPIGLLDRKKSITLSDMKHTINKLNQAQEKLGFHIPPDLFDYIASLKKPEVEFGNEEWLFWTLSDGQKNESENFIVSATLDFRQEWNLEGLVFATNGTGDYLLLLKEDESNEFSETIFVMMHETVEIKVFAECLDDLLEYGPEDYFYSDEFHFKLDDENKVVSWNEAEHSSATAVHESDSTADLNDLPDLLDDDDRLRALLDDLIDDHVTSRTSDIVQGLEKLRVSNDEAHKVWALNKLSDIYLRGFGPIPKDLKKALDLNQQAIELNSHRAYANRAACYFMGLGMERDLDKALEWVSKANELSKSNVFAKTIARKKDGGMYDSLVAAISKEIKKKKK